MLDGVEDAAPGKTAGVEDIDHGERESVEDVDHGERQSVFYFCSFQLYFI